MKKFLLLGFLLLSSMVVVNGQIVINSKFKPFTYDEMARPVLEAQRLYEAREKEAQRLYEAREKYLDALVDFTLETLSNPAADKKLKDQLRREYDNLKTYYRKPLSSTEVYMKLKDIELSIKEYIADCNIRNQTPKQYDPKVGQYLYKTTLSTTFRDNAYLRSAPNGSKTIYKCPPNSDIYILDNTVDNVFWEVWVNGHVGYISKACLKSYYEESNKR